MSQPVPEAVKQPSVFPVPDHVSSVTVGGGCGVAHVPQNGAVDCAACYPNAQTLVFPDAPAQEQPGAIAVEPLQPSPPADAPVPAAAAPAPDAADAPAKASNKKSSPDQSA